MAQGVLPFHYEDDKSSAGLTALGGLLVYLDLVAAAGLRQSIERHVGVRTGDQGWTDFQLILALLLLNLAGGDCVEDIEMLEADDGLGEVLLKAETHGMPRQQRRAFERRWRKQRERCLPSCSAIFRYLRQFHDDSEEQRRVPHTAFIPKPNEHLSGLIRVNADLVAFAQRCSPQSVATLDQDATIVETLKREALFCYKKHKGYQPFNTYWVEQALVLLSEFRDGNVPAGHDQLRQLKESLVLLPDGVVKVYLRSDTAGYQVDLIKYCAKGDNERFGVIEFAIGADVSNSFKKAVAEVAEKDWHPLFRDEDGEKVDTGQQWAEVCFVPDWAGHSKNGPDYRFLAIREPLRQLELPGIESPQKSFPFPVMDFGDKGRFKLFGVVTNRDLPGDELIWWHRARCGKSEQVHSVMKQDLAGGKMPSGLFGVNAAWWQVMVIALNLDAVMKRQVLRGSWVTKRMKAIRFRLINVAARVARRARQLRVRLTEDHPALPLLIEARWRILCLPNAPPG